MKKNNLSSQDKHKLNQWLESHKDRVALYCTTATLATEATKDLGVLVTKGNIVGALQATQVKWGGHRAGPRAWGTREAIEQLAANQRLISQVLVRALTGLNQGDPDNLPIPNRLLDMCGHPPAHRSWLKHLDHELGITTKTPDTPF